MTAMSDIQKRYVLIGLAALAIILLAVLLYLQYNALDDLRAEVEEEEAAVDAAQNHLNRLFSHRDRAAEYRERLAYAKSKIPYAAQEDQMIRYIHSLADRHGLKAVEISFGERAEEEEFTTMPLSLTLEGSYTGIRRLLSDLRSGERAVRIDDLNFSGAGGNGTHLQVSLSASTFYRP